MAGVNTSPSGGAVDRHVALATLLRDLKLQPSAVDVPTVNSKALKISPQTESTKGTATRVFNRRCETAAAASFLFKEVISYLQTHLPGCVESSESQALDPLQREHQRELKEDFERHIRDALCAMEDAGLLHDKKVLMRIEGAVKNLKCSIGLEAMPERKPSFFRGLFKTENDPEPIFEVLRQLDLVPGPSAAASPAGAVVGGDTADAELKSDSVSLASLQSIESALNAMVMDSIPTLQKNYRGEKSFSHSAVLALLRAGKFEANFSKLSAFLGTRKMQKLNAMLTENKTAAAAAGSADLKTNSASSTEKPGKTTAVVMHPKWPLYEKLMERIDMKPASSQIPASPSSRNPWGKTFAFYKTEKLMSNQIRHGDPLGHLEPDFFVLKGRMLKCASPYEHDRADGAVPSPTAPYQHWRGAQVLLSRDSSMKEPMDQIGVLIEGLRKLAQGHHDYANYVLDYLNAIDIDVLRWIVQNLTTTVGKAPSTIPRFHSRDCRNLLEALFCKGSTQPHCIHFFQALQSAFLLAIPVPERNEAVNVFLASCKAGVKFPSDVVEGKVQSALSEQWDVACQARAEAAKGFSDSKTSLQLPGALPVTPSGKDATYQAFHLQRDRFEKVYRGLILATAYQLNNCRQSLAALTDQTFVDYTPATASAPEESTDPRLLGLMKSAELDTSLLHTALLQLDPKKGDFEAQKGRLDSLGGLRVALHEEFKELIRLVDSQAGLIRQMVSAGATQVAEELAKQKAQQKAEQEANESRNDATADKKKIARVRMKSHSPTFLASASSIPLQGVPVSSVNSIASALQRIQNFSPDNPEHLRLLAQYLMNDASVGKKMTQWVEGNGRHNLVFSDDEYLRLIDTVSQLIPGDCTDNEQQSRLTNACLMTLKHLMDETASLQRSTNSDFKAGSIHATYEDGHIVLYVKA